MSRIRILYIIDEITNITAGTERQLSQLIKHIDRDRFEPHLLVLRNSEWLETDHFPCPKHSLELESVLSWAGFSKMNELKFFIADKNFHIVQTVFPDSNVVGVIAAGKAGCKAVISTRRNTGFFYTRRILFGTKMANRYVTCFLANSQLVVDAISQIENINRDRFSVIYNGLDPQRFKVEDEEVRSARVFMGAGENDSVVGIVANLRPVKDLGNFISAASIIASRRNHVKFAIVGGGEDNITSELKTMAVNLGLGDNLRFMGRVENPMPFIKNFDVGALTSFSEGLSNTLMEYGAMGVPSVVTDTGGNSEVIQDGRTGILVPMRSPEKTAEAIERLITDNDLRKEMGVNALQNAWSKFNLNVSVKMHQALYEKLYDQAMIGKD
jgi:glycosyltransferase involved in cell wall biosynthesis